MNRYTFCFTKKELKEFSIRAVLEQYRRRGRVWVILLLLCVLEAFISPAFSVVILFLFAAALGVDMFRTCRFLEKEHFLEKRILWVEDGLLKSSACGAGEIPCSRINIIVKSKNLLMLGYSQSKRQIVWYPLPLRVFENAGELERFRELFGKTENPAAGWSAGMGRQPQTGAVFSFTFPVDEEKWISIYKNALMTINSGTLGFPQNMKTFLGVYGVVFAVAGLFWFFRSGDHTPVFPAALFLMLVFLMLLQWKSDPEKTIRKQVRNGTLQNDIYGVWELHLMEEGVIQIMAGRSRSFLKWEEFGWLVETDEEFLLFKKNKVQFIPILKEGIQSYQQAEAMCRFCESRGIAGLPSKRMKYLPGWFFYVGLAFVLLAMFAVGIWSGFARDRQRAEAQKEAAAYADNEWTEAFDPADYPDYVPLDGQVETLRSLGFSITDQLADRVRGVMEDDMTRVYVEGYPYTWLLTELGVPSRDENGRICGYPEEVFWFDFEGWDISNDYTEVLEGMLALAGDSPLEDVTEISEDTEKMDWEAGSGSITVKLLWKGRSCSWDMDVEYDWIDPDILGVFNGLLEQTDAAERFYVIGDNGQGALVFYRTAEWAQAFEKATGLVPEAPFV